MHLEGMEADDHMVEDQQQQDEEHEDVKDKNLLAGGSGRSG